MLVRDIMQRDVVTVREDASVGSLLDRLTAAHVHAAPVVDATGRLLGIVSQEDILLGSFGTNGGTSVGLRWSGSEPESRVGDVMTSPAMSVSPDTEVLAVARMMWRFRIHHVPVVAAAQVVGIVSSLDFCRVVATVEQTTAH